MVVVEKHRFGFFLQKWLHPDHEQVQMSVFDKGPPSIEQHLCRPVSLTLGQIDPDECTQLNWLGAVFVRYDVENIRF